ncbi:ATP-binding protein [Acrocarpospora sp. B8E8]|uniref:ATP-binding protein n=1 Tax=Acrocarpospora sp. B8E8 TaxID=3153572 RepID=UPI00325EF391
MTPFQFFGYLELFGETTSVPAARHFVRDVLTGTGFDRIDDAELLVSELMSNTLAHVGGALSVAVTRSLGDILIEVTDRGSPASTPAIRPPLDGERPGGFGLVLVEEIASDWGSYTLQDLQGTCQVVWFTLPHPGDTVGTSGAHGRGPLTFEKLIAMFDADRSVAESLPRRPRSAGLSVVSGKERS